MKSFNKCLENDNNVVKPVAFISKSNPISCAGNNYRMLLRLKMSLQSRDYQYRMKDVVSWMTV